jgi:hypothetical protein
MKLWIVGQFIREVEVDGVVVKDWHFQGVFSTQEAAEAACVTDNYFVGPATLDAVLAHEEIQWENAYYPRLQPRPTVH